MAQPRRVHFRSPLKHGPSWLVEAPKPTTASGRQTKAPRTPILRKGSQARWTAKKGEETISQEIRRLWRLAKDRLVLTNMLQLQQLAQQDQRQAMELPSSDPQAAVVETGQATQVPSGP